MGLVALSTAWKLANQNFGLPLVVSETIGGAAILLFFALLISYCIKIKFNIISVRAELNHSVSRNLFATPSICFLLIPTLTAHYSLHISRILWAFGAVSTTIFTLVTIKRWLSVRQKLACITPALMIPAVGMLDIPLAVPQLQWNVANELMAFGLSIGLFFSIPLFSLIFERILLEEPLPPSLQPTLLILLTPFSVGFSAYITTVGSIDFFAEILYMIMIFLLCVLLGKLRYLPRCSPFHISWWAASLPLASSAVAAIRFAAHDHNPATDLIALTTLAIATLSILFLLFQTLHGITKGEFKNLT